MSIPDYVRTERPRRSNAVIRLARSIGAPVSALSFWSAIALPVLYVSLFATGTEGVHGFLQFVGLIALHVLALIGGRSHHRPSE